MSSDISVRKKFHQLALPVACFGLAGWQGLPSMCVSWGDDVYARGAASAFVVWLCTVLIGGWCNRRGRGDLWVVGCLLLTVLGALSGLRVLSHLAMVAAGGAMVDRGWPACLMAVASLSWLPATNWLLGHFLTGGIVGWERPVVAVLMAIIQLLLMVGITRSESTKSISA